MEYKGDTKGSGWPHANLHVEEEVEGAMGWAWHEDLAFPLSTPLLVL